MACGGFESRDHESVARWEISQQCVPQSDYRFSQFDNASSQRRRPKGIVFVRDALATCHLRLELENVCISDKWKQNILNLFIPIIRGLYQKVCANDILKVTCYFTHCVFCVLKLIEYLPKMPFILRAQHACVTCILICKALP